VVVVILCVVTLGIYSVVWYYMINRELRDLGRARDDLKLGETRPWLSVLAVTLGALLIVPPLVSYYKTTGRMRRAQAAVGANLTNGWIFVALYVTGLFLLIPLLAIPWYAQRGLNAVWEHFPRIKPGQLPADLASGESDMPRSGSHPDAPSSDLPPPRQEQGHQD
jgi:hypothetical protein